MIQRNILTSFVFILCCVACVCLSYYTSSTCETISNYSWTMQFGVGGVVLSLMRMVIIFIAGLAIWRLIKRKIQPLKYKRIKLLYFALLPLIIFSKQLIAVPGDLMNHSIAISACDKTTTNGIKTESSNLTLQEYDFLRTKFKLLPELPLTAEYISIAYYSDNFIGDYSLSVHFDCGIREVIGTKAQGWWAEPINGSNEKKSVTYEDERQ